MIIPKKGTHPKYHAPSMQHPLALALAVIAKRPLPLFTHTRAPLTQPLDTKALLLRVVLALPNRALAPGEGP
jgi:hypothetical protein